MIEHKLNLEQNQKLVVTRELSQAISLLAMPLLQLQQFIEEQLQENPILEQEYDNDLSEESLDGTGKDFDDADPLQNLINHDMQDSDETDSAYDWDKIADDWNGSPSSAVNYSKYADQNTYEPMIVGYSDIYEYLSFQLNVLSLSPSHRVIADFILENLGRDGYLLMLPETMADTLNVPLDELEEVLHLVRSLDPPGIGATSLEQCLRLQLDPADEDYEQLCVIINTYLDMVAANRLPMIAKKMKLPVEEVQRLVDKVRCLNPRPGLALEQNLTTEYIYPDVVIERIDDDFVVLVNDASVPKVGINPYCLRLIKEGSTADKETKDFIREKLDAAAWVIKGIEQRRRTIYKIAKAVIELQHDFFYIGPDYLVPLNMSRVAEIVGVHESTVSRAISNKHVQTPYGLFPWKYFFVNGVGDENNAHAAATNVKKALKALIDTEDSQNPLSDQLLAKKLEQTGFPLSRRTVAKYRQELGVPSAVKRKRF